MDSLLFYELGFMFSPTVILQPVLSVNGKTIRPDAIVFTPAFYQNKLIVECDGFEFHGSKEAFTSDRERDRRIASDLGIEVRRYSGNEIYHRPMDVGDDLYRHLTSKLGSMKPNQRKWSANKKAWIKRRQEGIRKSEVA